MNIRKADIASLEAVKSITHQTISAIYPRYYPKGAVDFFLQHHHSANIMEDILSGRVYIAYDDADRTVGTVTVKENEICRLFVLPCFQGNGYGTKLIDFAEKTIFAQYDRIVLDASLPAKGIYLKRKYTATEYHVLTTDNGDKLCYDVMTKYADAMD